MKSFKFKKIFVISLIFVISFSFFFLTPKKAEAQFITADLGVLGGQFWKNAWDKARSLARDAWERSGSIAYHKVMNQLLQKIAIDSAVYLASGDKGQKSLIIREGWGDYFKNIVDEAAGQFIETVVNEWHTNPDDLKVEEERYEKCETRHWDCLRACPQHAIPGTDYGEPSVECANKCAIDHNKCLERVYKSSLAVGGDPISVCQPVSLGTKISISLGLAKATRPVRPGPPNCTATQLVGNWATEMKKINPRTWDDRAFMSRISGVFDMRQNELGTFFMLEDDAARRKAEAERAERMEKELAGRYIDPINIAGEIVGVPGAAEKEEEQARSRLYSALFEKTDNIYIDALQTFTTTLAIEAFNNAMKKLGEKGPGWVSSAEDWAKCVLSGDCDDDQDDQIDTYTALSDPDVDPTIAYSDAVIREKITQLMTPTFSQSTDINIAMNLSVCPDVENPGQYDCVIDSSFLSAIMGRKTVIQAVKDGDLKRSWLLTSDNFNQDAYTLRNISILRKHRILPIGWEIAASLNRRATLMDLISCFDPSDDFNDFSSSFNLRDTEWCEGLIDPYWVLKAPLSFCQKQGVGGPIISKTVMAGQSIPSVNFDYPESPSYLSISRNEDYCADEKSCIKEDFITGDCLAYGYCNEEKRIWVFDSPDCQPVYNTCTSFISPEGRQAAFLENTLDYSVCNSDNVGCSQYFTKGSYSLDEQRVDWNINLPTYFNNKLETCSLQQEGCTELIRTQPGWGNNLIMGGNFENEDIGMSVTRVDITDAISRINNYWPIRGVGKATIIDAGDLGFSGGKLLKMETGIDKKITLYSNQSQSLLPNNFPVIPGYSYTFSADVYLEEGSGVKLIIGDNSNYSLTEGAQFWQRLSKTFNVDSEFPEFSTLEFSIENELNDEEDTIFYLRNLKLEINVEPSNYSVYGSQHKVYQRLIPPYLANVCYEDSESGTKDYRLKEDAPSICYNYARRCNQDEVGCILLTNTKNNFSIPAKPVTSDYCRADCEGYDVYIAQASHFHSPMAENLIPRNTRFCSADLVGCSEFTNLDDIIAGGERREYYSYLKHCIKPDENKCANFYTWEGDGEGGYQLRAMILEKHGTFPKLTSPDDTCDSDTYFLPPWDPDYNPDCRQFYNQAGQVSYRLMSRTITCSENCHTYRMTDNNIDYSLTNAAECAGIGSHWDASLNHCYVCKNNGVWSDTHNACLYQAIPGEGRTCSANMVGCREYTGKDGSNVRLVAAYNFNFGLEGWQGRCAHGAELANMSVSQNGRSLYYNTSPSEIENCTEGDTSNRIEVTLGHSLREGFSYSLQMLARAENAGTEISISFRNSDLNHSFFVQDLNISAGEWQIYNLDLPILNHSVDSESVLKITADNNFYIDSLVINEISDRYYMIKGTSDIPDVCYFDIFNDFQGEDYNLGCSRWTDIAGRSHYLRKISGLCHQSSVGCELMIDTFNQTDWRAKTICDQATGENCLEIPGDTFISAIFNRNQACLASDKGCLRTGYIPGSQSVQSLTSVYRRFNPDKYENSLCAEIELGCQAWRVADGHQHFKDPGHNTCVYRVSSDPESNERSWFKSRVKRCDLNDNGEIDSEEATESNICFSNDDCPEEINCIEDTNDYLCSVSYFKTIGTGGTGSYIPTPDIEVGLCDVSQSGCREYIDPVSQLNSPLPIFVESGDYKVNLNPNTLYLFTSSEINSSLNFGVNEVRIFDNTRNNFATTTVNEITITNENRQIYFHSQLSTEAKVLGYFDDIDYFIVKPINVSYQLKDRINAEGCNGVTNFDNGCILFNERLVSRSTESGYNNLNFDAFSTQKNRSPIPCSGADCINNANKLIKVRPDRVCARWLDCQTYIIDPDTNEKICYSLGECTSLNDENECNNFVSFRDSDDNPVVLSSGLFDNSIVAYDSAGNAIYFNNNRFSVSNLTGYSSYNRFFLGEMREVGVNTDIHITFDNPNTALHCRRNIGRESGAYIPSAFFPFSEEPCNFTGNISSASLVLDPSKAPTDYPAQGEGYLKVLAYHQVSPHSENYTFSLLQDQDYYIHYLLNTKDSGLEAVVIIYDKTKDEVVWHDKALANSGWERQVHKIPMTVLDSYGSNDDLNSFQIFLTSNTENEEEAYIYFDDLHIEPVLKVGPDEYIAKDCRLYPESDSLSCFSSDANVVKHGLEGYCLERDPINKDLCLTWYPVDQITSSQLGARQTRGYQGKSPLFFCSEVNADFKLMEKRIGYYVGYGNNVPFWRGSCNETPATGWECSSSIMGTWFNCARNINSSGGERDTWSKKVKYGVTFSGDCCEVGHSGADGVNLFCGGDPNYMAVAGGRYRDSDRINTHIFCIPRADKIKLITARKTITIQDTDGRSLRNPCQITYYEGWGDFNGFTDWFFDMTDDSIHSRFNQMSYSDSEDQFFGVDKNMFSGGIFESQSHNPPIAVFDIKNPPKFEEDLKFIAHTDREKVYELTCNRFVQLVDPDGINKAWTGRTSSLSNPLETNNFMVYNISDWPFYNENPPGTCSWNNDHTPPDCRAIVTCNDYMDGYDEDNCQFTGGEWTTTGEVRTSSSSVSFPAMGQRGWHREVPGNGDGGECVFREGHGNDWNCRQNKIYPDRDNWGYYRYCHHNIWWIWDAWHDMWNPSGMGEASYHFGCISDTNHEYWSGNNCPNPQSAIDDYSEAPYSHLPYCINNLPDDLDYNNVCFPESMGCITTWPDHGFSCGGVNKNYCSNLAAGQCESNDYCEWVGDDNGGVPWEPGNGGDPEPEEPCCINDTVTCANTYCDINVYSCTTNNICSGLNKTDCEDLSDYCQFTLEWEEDDEPWIKYGREREDVPFGAAILPDNFNFYSSPPIKLRNQYSEINNQSIFAGRPYGCAGESCGNIGQCSLNPNVFCVYYNDPENTIVGSDRINNDSCAKGNYGTCVPLWRGEFDKMTADDNFFFEYPLKTIFLRSFGGFKYTYADLAYESHFGYRLSGSEDYVLPRDGGGKIQVCNNNVRASKDLWCLVPPKILSSVRLIPAVFGNNGPGLYYLRFNTVVDLEQQPLRQIQIDWGDGTSQIITNQDHRPLVNNPHRIYHYFSEKPTDTIEIKIIDNWGAWGNYSYDVPR